MYGGSHCVGPVHPRPPHCPQWGTRTPVGATLVVAVVTVMTVVMVVKVVAALVVVGVGAGPPKAEAMLSKKPGLPYTWDISLISISILSA